MSPEAAYVQKVVQELGPLAAFHRLVAENEALIRGPELGNGALIVASRTAIYTELVRGWAAEQQQVLKYDKPFAVVALGGTGRAEMTPRSDTDFAFLFDDAIEGNRFLLELQHQVLHADTFERQNGFSCRALPFSLDDIPGLHGLQLNSFLDMRAVYDPTGLAAQFRGRIRSTFDPFEHFLHVRGFWKDRWEKAVSESERVDHFDIKNEGLRLFLAGIWTLAGKEFLHSHEVYQTLDDPRDLEAYHFLLRLRAFVHSRRADKTSSRSANNAPDVLGFEDFISFGELLGPDAGERMRFEFGNEVRARLLSARRRVARFATGIIQRELKEGRTVSPTSQVVYGASGLRYPNFPRSGTRHQKSRAAITLLLTAQRYAVPLDPSELQTTFLNAGDWLTLVPELSTLFYEEGGSLADTFAFLSLVEGAEEQLFPGYAKFEASLDARVMTERKSLRSVLERQKMRALEHYVRAGRTRLDQAISTAPTRFSGEGVAVAVEAALLDANHLAAVKLALKTKRLPLTAEDELARGDESLPFHERFSSGISGIPLAQYYEPYVAAGAFPRETVRIASFLIANRRAFKERAQSSLNDNQQVIEFARLCKDEQTLRSLFVFTFADHAEWEAEHADPARWFNTRELYVKAMKEFQPDVDPERALTAAGYSAEQAVILRDFGEDFFGGLYRQYANRLGAQLVRLVEEPDTAGPRAVILRDNLATIIGVAARDYRGLAATISGAFWHCNVALQQAHLFSASRYGLALDFFHLAPRDQPLPPDLTKFIEEAIRNQRYIGETDEAKLPPVKGLVSLREWRPGRFCLRFEAERDVSGLIYSVTYKVYRHLRGNIFGLAAHAARGRAYVAVYHSLPPELSLAEAQAIAGEHF